MRFRAALALAALVAALATTWAVTRPAVSAKAAGPAGAESAVRDAPSAAVEQDRPALPETALRVPLVRQKTGYSCGAAAALALVRYFRYEEYKDVDERALYALLGTTPEAGTEPGPIARFLAGFPELHATYRQSEPGRPVELGEVERALDAGDPVLVDIEAWQDAKRPEDRRPWATDWIDGHYVVAVAHDRARLYFMDPSTLGHYTYIDKREFETRWHDVLGPREEHVEHMTVFVHADHPSLPPAAPLPREVTPID
jgi:predicted double-glycine peptidase